MKQGAALGLIALLGPGCAPEPQLIAYTSRKDVGRVVQELPLCYAHRLGTNVGWWDLSCLAQAGYRVELYDPILARATGW